MLRPYGTYWNYDRGGIAIIASVEWLERVQRELQIAEAARARDNEGMARVCARRAAGWAVEAYLRQQGVELKTSSVLEMMRHLKKYQSLAPEMREILEHMLLPKQKPDLESESFSQPGVDLVAEARRLIGLLFPNQSNRADH